MKTKKLRIILSATLLALSAKAILLFIAAITIVFAAAIVGALGFRMRNMPLPDITIEHIPPGETNILTKLANMPANWVLSDALKVTNGVIEMSVEELLAELEGVHTWALETTTDLRSWTEFGVPFVGGEVALKEHLEFISKADRLFETKGMRMYRGRREP